MSILEELLKDDPLEDYKIEKAFAIGIEVGVLQLSKELGLLEEKVPEKQAERIHGKDMINKWRKKRWIILYSTGNEVRAKYYYKRSELETACRMEDYGELIIPNKLKDSEYLDLIQKLTTSTNKKEKLLDKKTGNRKLKKLTAKR